MPVIVYTPPRAADCTVKVQPATIEPPDTEHCGFDPLQRVVDGPENCVKVTDVSEVCQPVPVTVTTVPVGPLVGVKDSTAVAPPTMNGGEVAIGAADASPT